MSLELLSWVLVVEVGVAGLAALYFIYFVLGKQKKEQRKLVSSVVKVFRKNGSKRTNEMAKGGDFSSMDESALDQFLQDIGQSESLLYQQITRVFLHQDAASLNLCDERVAAVSASYLSFLGELTACLKAEEGDEGAGNQVELEIAISEQERLKEQLATVLATLDQVSSEYAHLFSSSKDQDELKESKAKMMEHFKKPTEMESI